MRPLFQKKQLRFIAFIFLVYLIGVLAIHLYLSYENWIEQGEAAELWSCSAALFKPMLFMALLQYICIYLAFLLSYIFKNILYPWLALVLLIWGLTWMPVAYVCTSDFLRSGGGPFGMPISAVVIPVFAAILLAEAAIVLIIRGCTKSADARKRLR